MKLQCIGVGFSGLPCVYTKLQNDKMPTQFRLSQTSACPTLSGRHGKHCVSLGVAT